jgi:hypothetical protein
MQSVLRSMVLSAFVLVVGTPLLAQLTTRQVPEGGSDLAYLSVAGISCLSAIWYRVRRK